MNENSIKNPQNTKWCEEKLADDHAIAESIVRLKVLFRECLKKDPDTLANISFKNAGTKQIQRSLNYYQQLKFSLYKISLVST